MWIFFSSSLHAHWITAMSASIQQGKKASDEMLIFCIFDFLMKLVDVMLISTNASTHHINIVLQISHDNVPCLEKKIFEKKKNKFEKKKKNTGRFKVSSRYLGNSTTAWPRWIRSPAPAQFYLQKETWKSKMFLN